MPDVQEVFRMATQNVRQDAGALDRQVSKQRKAERNRRVSAFATVLILIAGVVAAYAFTRSGDTTPMPGNAPEITVGPGAAPANLIDLSTGSVTPLPAQIASVGSYFAVSPDGTKVAYNDCCSSPSPLLMANLDGTDVQVISEAGTDAHGAQWSADGSMLVYQQRDATTQHLGNIYVVDADGKNRRQLTNLDQTRSWGLWFMFPSFSADGDSILYHEPRGVRTKWDLWSVPVAGGAPTIVRRNASWGDYSPDGGSLAYVSPSRDFSGTTLWLAIGGTKPIPVVYGAIAWPRWSLDGTQISYQDDGGIYVLDVGTGSRTKITDGSNAEWVGNDTLIVGRGGG